VTGLGIQAWGLLFNGLRIAPGHGNVVDFLEILRVLGHSYRLASAGDGSGIVFGRFMLGFSRTVVAVIVCELILRKRGLRRFAAFESRVRVGVLQALPRSTKHPSQHSGRHFLRKNVRMIGVLHAEIIVPSQRAMRSRILHRLLHRHSPQ
jgi:hypothetical protein